MPSPLAHTALVCLTLPAALGRGERIPIANRVALAAMICVVLVLPDFDFVFALLGLTLSEHAHGTWSHSLLMAIPAGMIFAVLAGWVFPAGQRPRFARLAMVGAAAYASHIFMDWLNWGFGNARGVAMFWPVLEERFKSPVPIFLGVRWSEPGEYLSHLLTLLSELLFVVIIVTLRVFRSRRQRAEGEVS